MLIKVLIGIAVIIIAYLIYKDFKRFTEKFMKKTAGVHEKGHGGFKIK